MALRVAWSVNGVLRRVHLVRSVDTVSPWQSPVRVLLALCGPSVCSVLRRCCVRVVCSVVSVLHCVHELSVNTIAM